jgi:hypothetical protein
VYAVLQAVLPALSWRDDPFGEYVGYAAVIIALYSKLVLLVVVEWARDKYRVQYFMLRARQIYLDERRGKQHHWFAYQARELYHPTSEEESPVARNGPGDSGSTADQTNVVSLSPRDKGIGG